MESNVGHNAAIHEICLVFPIVTKLTILGRRDFLGSGDRDGALDAPMRKRARACEREGSWEGNGE